MAIGTTGIHWLDLLESEFDKSFVDLDMLIGEIDEDQIEIIYAARQKLTALSTAFAQLSHKSQVVFENSIKLEVC
ncbi:golgi-associated PDZ and coiled-coil motif-containing protein [Trichonephila clavata]|uniref:Golgi-associated PDZ and coiled-coil motif-containing protein n=1 Tax=Trichonephila clavata TaxID=2740835 RepID=A0A8X6I4H2_TRICU|nr:golgi-associated PDZ and coiled-coil motif-containing protein [Trichonephila clavata]